MFSWLGRRMVGRNMAALRAGDPGPVLRMDADDVRFFFPGDSSWSGQLDGKAEHERWLARFVAVGLATEPDEVVVQGPPWRTTICVRGRSYLRGADGQIVYDNRYVLWGRLAWGKLKEYEAYEDTPKSRALDDYLVSRE